MLSAYCKRLRDSGIINRANGLTAALFLVLSSFVSNANAASEPVVITVSAEALPLSEAPASVTVITHEQIENSHADTVAQLLKQTAFLHISQNGPIGGLTTVTLRGGDPNFTLVMIDGVPVNDPTNLLGGSFDFSLLSTDNIERIEIVRGPLSSLYGSEAMSGVINIISRRGQREPSLSFGAAYGTFNTRDIHAETQALLKNWDYSLSASYLDIGEQVKNDAASLGTISLASGIRLNDTAKFTFNARFNDKNSAGFPENGGGPLFSILDESKQVNAKDLLLSSGYENTAPGPWILNAGLDFFNHVEDSDTPAILDAFPPGPRSQPAFVNNSDFNRTRLRFSGTYKHPSITGVLGFGLNEERGTSDALIANQFPSRFHIDRTTSSINGELLYEKRNLNGSIGLHYDKPDGFSAEWSPRLGVSYLLPRSATRIKTSWGKAFKLPSFFALGEPNVGNPALKPERTQGFDFGIEQQINSPATIISLTYFYNTFNDLIDFSPEEFRLVNRSAAISRGMELEASTALALGFTLGGHLNYMKEDLLHTDEPLRDRPRWRGGINIGWRDHISHVSVDFLSVGDRFDFQLPLPDRSVAPAYHTIDAGWDRRLTDQFQIYTRIDNLLGSKYQEFVGFPNPGRYIRFGIRFRLKPDIITK